MQVQLFLTPLPLDKADLDGRTVVVIDVLRSSTSMCAALQAGAKGIIPVAEPGEAGNIWSQIGPEGAVLAGERGGVKIENFQLGNSPTEFTPQAVKNKNVIMCTSNGTGIFGRVARAEEVLCGAFVNLPQVVEAVGKAGHDLVIACAGREGSFSLEDTLCGGMIIDHLGAAGTCDLVLDDAAAMASLLYHENSANLSQAVAGSEHGRFLASIGLEADLDICSAVASIPILPVWHDGRLVLRDGSDDHYA